jgi:hypothetical protein
MPSPIRTHAHQGTLLDELLVVGVVPEIRTVFV